MQKIEGATEYNEIVLRHFQSPSNVGEIEEPDGVGEYISDICADITRIYLKVNNNRIIDTKFRCFGCVGSIACSSALTEIILGKEVDVVEKVKEADILDALGGLPEHKTHCAALALRALRSAVESYHDHQRLRNVGGYRHHE